MNDLGRSFLKTRMAFWFCLIAPFVITIISFFKSPNESIALGFFSLCTICLTAIVGNKANTTYQKSKIERESIKNVNKD